MEIKEKEIMYICPLALSCNAMCRHMKPHRHYTDPVWERFSCFTSTSGKCPACVKSEFITQEEMEI